VLEGVQVDVAAVERLVGQVVRVELHQFDVDVRALVVEHLLGRNPLLVVAHAAAHADLHDGLALFGGLVAGNFGNVVLSHGKRRAFVIRESREERLMVVDQQELRDKLGLIGLDDLLVNLVVLVRSAGDDHVHIWVFAVLVLLLDEQRVAGGDQAVGHGVGAVDGGGGEIAQRGGQRVRRNRRHFHVVEVLGDVLDFRGIARRRINLDEARGFQQLDAAGEVRAVVRHAELERSGRQRGGRGQGKRCRRGQRNDFLRNAIHKM